MSIQIASEIPALIRVQMSRGVWRDPGSNALRQLFSNILDLPNMKLFETVGAFDHVRTMIEAGGYITDPEFCMVQTDTELSSPDDPRLVFAEATLVAGSTVPGDDVFVAVAHRQDGARIYVFDWNRRVPHRWVPAMGLVQFCSEIEAIVTSGIH